MKKLTFCLRRKPGMTWEQFETYWREVHAPLVRGRAEVLGIHRYVQVRTLRDAHLHQRLQSRNDGAPEPYDGIAEIWYDDEWPPQTRSEVMRQAARELLEDERNFIDLSESPMSVGHEWNVLAGDSSRASSCLDSAHLVGVWSLVQWTIQHSDRRPIRFPFGREASGQLLYAPEGHMSVTVVAAGRPALQGGSIRYATVEEKVIAFDGLFHYAGTYRVEGNEVVHHVALSSNPSLQGTDQRRKASLEVNTLSLSTSDGVGEKERVHVLIWRKTA